MFNKWLNHIKSDFIRNTLILMTGSTLAQAIPIMVSPILTRIYTPEDFGILALFTSVTAVFGTMVTARYELAILLPADDEEGKNITTLSIFTAGVLSLVLFLLFWIFNESISSFLGNKSVGPWLYFAPLVIFFSGIYNSFKFYSIRKNSYSAIAKAGAMQSVASAILQTLGGVFNAGSAGLILGNGIPFVLSNKIVSKSYFTDVRSFTNNSMKELKNVAIKYIEFPKFSLLANTANILSQNLIIIFISSFYTTFILGQYSLVNRILSIPSIVIGGSIADVFTKKAIDEKVSLGNCSSSFKKTFINLSVLSLVIFLPAYFLVEPLFGFIFGENWIIAGTYAKIIMPLLAIRFLMSPLTMVFVIYSNKQITALLWQFIFLLSSLISFVIAYHYNLEIKTFLRLFTYNLTFIYFLQFFVLKKIADNDQVVIKSVNTL